MSVQMLQLSAIDWISTSTRECALRCSFVCAYTQHRAKTPAPKSWPYKWVASFDVYSSKLKSNNVKYYQKRTTAKRERRTTARGYQSRNRLQMMRLRMWSLIAFESEPIGACVCRVACRVRFKTSRRSVGARACTLPSLYIFMVRKKYWK